LQQSPDDLPQGLQPMEVFPSHAILLVGMWNRMATREHESGTSTSSLSKNHAFHHPTGGSGIGMEK
jgi:hypothetical protein